METKYAQLKKLIKEKSEFQRVLKNHRKTERFIGERLKNIKLLVKEHEYDSNYHCFIWKDKEIIIDELDNYSAARILDGNWESKFGLGTTKELQRLYTIYGILRNERKTKKIKEWEDIVNSKGYESSYLRHQVDSWRDNDEDEIVETGEDGIEEIKNESTENKTNDDDERTGNERTEETICDNKQQARSNIWSRTRSALRMSIFNRSQKRS